MPSSSRKRNKGQARKAKSKANLTAVVEWRQPNNSVCNHGIVYTHHPCGQFIDTFFQSFTRILGDKRSVHDIGLSSVGALDIAYNKFPEAVNNNCNREIIKKSIIGNGAAYVLHNNQFMSLGCAAALLIVDSYAPSSTIQRRSFDDRDAKTFLRNSDTLNGCKRSLIKYFMNQIPCKCLDESYAKIKLLTPKIGVCIGCGRREDRNSLYMCTGCERVMYCNKACQIAHVDEHKQDCKRYQRLHG